jgi:Ca2+-transporting ATPase
LFAAAACCDAQLTPDGGAGVGDPTEVALLLAASARGIEREQIERTLPRVAVNPFDPVRKRMSVGRADGVLYVKGALDLMLAHCAPVAAGARAAAERMAESGLRVLAVATGQGSAEADLHLLGLVGIADPPRAEAIAAVALARRAGVRTVMITGDHPVTARAIAAEMGILADGGDAQEVVHARATPADKLRIVKQLKARGEVVAMTGDGVNDAPALREAHVGIAMGITGTEVTREAADMILADDNFASVVTALREGRSIFDNIRKTVAYLLAGNVAELLVMLLASLAALPQPLLPLHILWINLVTDGLPALALATDAPDSDVLARAPRAPGAPMLGRREWTAIVLVGCVQAAVALGVFVWALQSRGLDQARNMAFTALVIGELFRAFGARQSDKPVWEMGFAGNRPLLAIVLVSVAVQFGIHHVPLLQALLQIAPIGWSDCAVAFLCGLIPLGAIEAWKVVVRRAAPARGAASAPTR